VWLKRIYITFFFIPAKFFKLARAIIVNPHILFLSTKKTDYILLGKACISKWVKKWVKK